MKIAFIGQKGMPIQYGGVEKHVHEVALRLAKIGHDVTVYTRPYYTDPKTTEYKGVKLRSIKTIRKKNIDAIYHTFLCTIDAMKQDYDIIHYQMVGPSLLSFIPHYFKSGSKVVSTFHAQDKMQEKWSKFAKTMLALGEWTITHTTSHTFVVAKQILDYCKEKWPNRPMSYIPNGIEYPEVVSSEEAQEELKKFKLEPGKYLINVGRFMPDKGIHYLIDAWKKLSDDMRKDLKLVLVGDTELTDDYMKELKEMTKNREDIVFTGFQGGKTLESLYQESKFYVHPSRHEGLPFVVLEAMSYGKAVLASNIPANVEILKDIGVLFKTKNVEDLKENLEDLLTDTDKLEKTAKDCKEHVFKHYHWDTIIQQMDKHYIKVQTQKK